MRRTTRRTWAVRGNYDLKVDDVSLDLVRLPHTEQYEASWEVQSTAGDTWSPDQVTRQGVRDLCAQAIRETRQAIRDEITEATDDAARDLLESLIDSGMSLGALRALRSLRSI